MGTFVTRSTFYYCFSCLQLVLYREVIEVIDRYATLSTIFIIVLKISRLLVSIAQLAW